MWLKHSEKDFILILSLPLPQKKEWAEMAKGIDNEVNSEANKENMRALLKFNY